ncbi:TetR family transcriptional regulator [Mycobacterium sp. CBMA 234]|uniref:TetR/AcrR family transcriptional regulator n=1 Tax=Mycolicibacterium sp. CBMA 234 TaxID=1918495 RepID=UPI001391AB6F|nr:TetR/AcrR family transcriptional regulator [Mycolicibacterium sp. CBMA 234]MUL64735.1 TetR family transcriptional regulator [Mycolicibacterium sp. CBMA 234]
MPQVRPYRGIDATERLAQRRARLIDAGLDLLGAAPPAPELTVRVICGRAGVAMRYFYESFTDKDDFVAAVFDHVITGLATTTQAAVAAVPPAEQSRAGMANIVHAIADDARVGRLLFSAHLSNEVVARKRHESTAFFAMLLGQHAGGALQLPSGERLRASTHFAVGGVGQTLSAWLSDEITYTPDELIDHLALLLDTLGKRTVHR